MSFDFCVQNTPPPPANNECTGAIAITTQSFGIACAASVSANTSGATHSVPDASCGATDSNDDIWYSFTAGSQSIILRFSNASLTTSSGAGVLGYALYNGSCPSSATTVSCNPGFGFVSGYTIIDGLTIGNTYYLRLFSAGTNNYMSFDFCVQNVPPPPVNDECAAAIPVSLTLPGTYCVASSTANTNGATLSANSPSCVSGSNNDDVWYSFTALSSTAIFRYSNCIETTTGNNSSLGYALYSSCPTGTTSMACSNSFGFSSGSVSLTGLIAGNTYLLRLFGTGANNYVSFNFCIQTPLVNDECINATNVPVSNGFCNTPLLASLNGATTSAGFGAPSCTTSGDSKDVWFKVTVPSTGNLVVQTSAVKTAGSDLIMTAYTGVCGSLTELICDNNSNPEPFPSANHPRITLTGRTPGEIILLRVVPFLPSHEEQFAICAWDETISVLPPVAPGGNCIGGAARSIDSTQGNIYMWVPLFDNNGNIIAEVYGDGNNLGNITSDLFVNTSGTVRNTNGKFYLDRNITLNPVVNGSARLRLYFKDNELAALQAADPAIAGVNNLKITKTATGCLPAFSGTPVVLGQQGNGTYGVDHYLQLVTPSFSSFYIDGLTGVLPLRFLSFTGNKEAAGNKLKWIVVKDESIMLFKIQRSSDGLHFETIATQHKNDFISEVNNEWEYISIDNNVSKGRLFYRIEMSDNNGKLLYSRILQIGGGMNERVLAMVYPNPVDEIIMIHIVAPSGGLQMELLDMSGKKIRQINTGFVPNELVSVTAGGLANGMYTLVVTEPVSGARNYIKIVKR